MRFAVLHHSLPECHIRPSHWDLLLQFSNYHFVEERCLDCFELNLPPDQWSSLAVTRLPSHRALYLNYSGPISGNRGSVELVLTGEMKWHVREEHNFEFELIADPSSQPNQWNVSGQRFQLSRQGEDHWFLKLQPSRTKNIEMH